jgi:hypothetical protein
MLAAQSPNLAKWRSVTADGRIVSSYVLIGHRMGRVPIRLGLVGGIRIFDFLSTISIAKLLLELDLAPVVARDFALFAYPVANPSRALGTEPDFDTSFWKGSPDPVIRFFERELTTGEFDGLVAVRGDEPLAGFQIQISSDIIGKEVLWRALELPQKVVPLADETHSDSSTNGGFKTFIYQFCSSLPQPLQLGYSDPEECASRKPDFCHCLRDQTDFVVLSFVGSRGRQHMIIWRSRPVGRKRDARLESGRNARRIVRVLRRLGLYNFRADRAESMFTVGPSYINYG